MYVCVAVVVLCVIYAKQPFGESLNPEKMPIPTPVKKVNVVFYIYYFVSYYFQRLALRMCRPALAFGCWHLSGIFVKPLMSDLLTIHLFYSFK
jgi:hypothetical protein